MRSMPPNPSLEYLRKQAKALVRAVRSGEPDAMRRIEMARSRTGPDTRVPSDFSHADALLVIAHEAGFPSWPALKYHVESMVEDGTRPDVFAIHLVTELDRRFWRLFPQGAAAMPVRTVLRTEADAVLEAHRRGDGDGVMQIRDWVDVLIGKSPAEIVATPLTRVQVRDGVAKEHGYGAWGDVPAATAASLDPVFERAVDAVVTGRLDVLAAMLDDRPSLVRERSAYGHRATLLHYVAANGVETRRQMSPANAEGIVRLLVRGGADPDALCETYGGGDSQTPLCLTVTSAHPAEAGVQVGIVRELLAAGAAVEGVAGDGMPLRLALSFGYRAAAEVLVSHGARLPDG